ncbi:hypothetical protein MMC28_002779 [Mycoblastus sanguinarius]|nr:hypothetical protein [Mycoblastus sanguinarius]
MEHIQAPKLARKNPETARLDAEKADEEKIDQEQNTQEQEDQKVDRCCVCNSGTEIEELIVTTCCCRVVGSLCFEEGLDETGECVLCQQELSPHEIPNPAPPSMEDGQYLEHFVEQELSPHETPNPAPPSMEDGQSLEHFVEKVCPQPMAGDDGYEVPLEKLTASFTLRLFDQRVINLLRDKNPEELLKILHEALEDDPSRIHLFPRLGWLSRASQLESGDVEVFVRRKVVENLKHVNGNTSWAQSLETQIIAGIPSYKVETRISGDNNLRLTDPLDNSKAIMELVGLGNTKFLNRPDDIYEMRWLKVDTNGEKQGSKVLIAFSTPKQANEAIMQGLWWNGKQYPCKKPESLCPTKFQQCMRCQEIGHSEPDCTSPIRCHICAGPHGESECVGTNYRCALCGRAHVTRNKRCPQIKAEKRRIQFLTHFYCDEEGEPVSTGSANLKNSPSPATPDSSPMEKASDNSSKIYTSVREFNRLEQEKRRQKVARATQKKLKKMTIPRAQL